VVRPVAAAAVAVVVVVVVVAAAVAAVADEFRQNFQPLFSQLI